MPSARLRALERLSAGGIRTGLYVAPILPGITDDLPGLERLFSAARAAGAGYIMGSPLRLGAAAKARFFPHLDREFPELSRAYRVQAVPKIVINDRVQFEGALPEAQFLEAVLRAAAQPN